MGKSKKKSTFFWICVTLAVLAIISLIVYLVICSCKKESYNNYCNNYRSDYHNLNDMVCCDEEDVMIKYGEVKDEDIEVPENVPENVRKYYIQREKLFVKLQKIGNEYGKLEKKENKTEEDEKRMKQLDKEFIDITKKYNKVDEKI